MQSKNYDPESYWTEVAERIEARSEDHNVIAGDDEPYYRYKREQFLKLLSDVSFKNKSVLEVGCGPGGNLRIIHQYNPQRLTGSDISAHMVKLARKNVPDDVEIVKIDGAKLPFEDNTFDIVFTATVLQHNTNEEGLRQIVKEICRVSADRVYLFERIEPRITGDDLCLGRPVKYYSALMAENNFSLRSHKFINIRASYYISGGIRKLLNSKSRQEGEPLSAISLFFQKITLPVTRIFDKIFTSSKDIARLEYSKTK